jgi:molecular chaperone DnaJ
MFGNPQRVGVIGAQQQQRHDYYKILGVMRTANSQEIKKAYHRMSLKYHPDKNKEEGAEDHFMLIAEAYEVLSDEDRRRNYDNSGSGDERPDQGGGETRRGRTSHEPFDILL